MRQCHRPHCRQSCISQTTQYYHWNDAISALVILSFLNLHLEDYANNSEHGTEEPIEHEHICCLVRLSKDAETNNSLRKECHYDSDWQVDDC